MVSQLTRRKFTVDEYHKMVEAGILGEDDRIELLNGEIVEMTPIGPEHAGCVKTLIAVFTSWLVARIVLGVQDTVRLGPASEPQPDLSLLRPRRDGYRSSHPGPEDVMLLVEVADTTLRSDRTEKLPLYARHGIREVWLVNLVEQRIEVYRDPSPDGYKAIRHATRGDTVSPLAFPDLVFKVEEVLG